MARHTVTRSELDGQELITLTSPGDDGIAATFAPGAGMVGCSLIHWGQELLETRGGLGNYVEKRSTMGIPFLHPWANRLSALEYDAAGKHVDLEGKVPPLRLDPNGLPIHGSLAATKHWRVDNAAAGSDAASLHAHLDYAAHEELMAVFPYAHTLDHHVSVAGNKLTIETALRATGEDEVPISFGWHPYFKLPDVAPKDWLLEMPVRRHVKVDQQMIPTGETEDIEIATAPLGDRTFDDGYDRLDKPTKFAISGGGRRIEVEFLENYPVAIVWRPENGGFICFEPMTARTSALSREQIQTVAPGGTLTARWSVTVSATDAG
jgi:galactose mutarotase-like enzyme